MLGKPLNQFLEAQQGKTQRKAKEKDRYISITHDLRDIREY